MVNPIKTIRKEKGWTQEKLANAIGVKRSVISKYENGSISPSVETLYRIAEALNVKVRELLSDDGKKNYDAGYSLSGYIPRIIDAFFLLNDEGQAKVVKYAEDILPNYQRDDQQPLHTKGSISDLLMDIADKTQDND